MTTALNLSRNARRAAFLVLVIAAAFAGSGTSSAENLADAEAPRVIITSPTDAYVFGPGESISVTGRATDNIGLAAVKVQYWLAGQLRAQALATCGEGESASTSCSGLETTWAHAPELDPGYYSVKAYAYDLVGNASLVATRTFAFGAKAVPVVPLPTAPDVPGAPVVPAPSILEPKQGSTVPAADKPVPMSGTAKPNSDVTVYEVKDTGGSPIATVRSGKDGTWSTTLHLPSGSYTVGAETVAPSGKSSGLGKTIRFRVDADRPVIAGLTPEGTLFTPLEPVTIEGTFFDNRRLGYLVVEYWLANKLLQQNVVVCPACDKQEWAWSQTPNLPNPGYYYVRVRGFDKAGNGAWTETTTFIKTI